ncbi:Coatomer_alpha subunit [Hexamita inflata]|uniref:Coatomer alpha subunit n=1 Tax=Hexamita inflata TaxID=28002 RepID=A0AA86QVQ7_9EUKA|nr:Coatomer alpha subunit [Hexamita inflata]
MTKHVCYGIFNHDYSLVYQLDMISYFQLITLNITFIQLKNNIRFKKYFKWRRKQKFENVLRKQVLRAELKRKLESTGEEEHPQLLLIFAAQKLEPLHKILVLKLAMNKLKKQYSKYIQAKMCSIELIKLAKESMKIDYIKLEICECAEFECPCCGSESIQRRICTAVCAGRRMDVMNFIIRSFICVHQIIIIYSVFIF